MVLKSFFELSMRRTSGVTYYKKADKDIVTFFNTIFKIEQKKKSLLNLHLAKLIISIVGDC